MPSVVGLGCADTQLKRSVQGRQLGRPLESRGKPGWMSGGRNLCGGEPSIYEGAFCRAAAHESGEQPKAPPKALCGFVRRLRGC
jgi:hypothetical protein